MPILNTVVEDISSSGALLKLPEDADKIAIGQDIFLRFTLASGVNA